jgi:hypothetical protein
MQKQIALFALMSASIIGCAGRAATESTPRLDDATALDGAKVEVLAEGGIAALSINQVVRHDDRSFLYTQRHLCNNGCAAMDSASGSLSSAATDSLFTLVVSQAPLSLKDDYGDTRGAADMMIYTVRVTVGGSTKSIHADDGTMPEPLRRIVTAVRETISAGRK